MRLVVRRMDREDAILGVCEDTAWLDGIGDLSADLEPLGGSVIRGGEDPIHVANGHQELGMDVVR
jgi:hypothetical protein